MGIFNNMFGGNKDEKTKEEKKSYLNWIPLTSLEQLEKIKEESKTNTVLIFKHSTRCGVSKMVIRQFDSTPQDYHLLYQLPTGGGKTVIFSEIVRRYIQKFNKKVLVLTHRIELSKQTSRMLKEFGVKNKIINSTAKLDDQDEFNCFVAMVETLKNRLNDDKLDISDIGLVASIVVFSKFVNSS